jgi:predicted nucleic acid-binding protein
MKDPASGPFLLDTSAERWLATARDPALVRWYREYTSVDMVYVSAVTVMERIRGYALIWHKRPPDRRIEVDPKRINYLNTLGKVLPLDTNIAIVAAEIMALVPHPPARRRRSHRLAEPRQERLARWRFDVMIAATALVEQMTLIHNNAEVFEAIRSAIERSPQRFPKLGPLDLVRCNALA